MTDKPKKFEEITKFAHNFNNYTVNQKWDEWKTDIAAELDNHVETEEELDDLINHIEKENIGSVCKNIFETAAEDLRNEKYDNGEWE
mgnify:CR=1 FL=1